MKSFQLTLEKLKDPTYVETVESFFNVTGVAVKRTAYCQRESDVLNSMFPLVIRNETRDKLVELNQLDSHLYSKITGCNAYDMPKFDDDRFEYSKGYIDNTEEGKARWLRGMIPWLIISLVFFLLAYLL